MLRRRHAIGRRGFLTLGGSAAVGACAGENRSRTGSGDKWASVRAQFDQDPEYANFCGFILASHPKPVREAIERHRQALDRNPAVVMEEMVDRLLAGGPHPEIEARQGAARFLGVQADQIALTDSTTMGLGLVYGGFAFAKGQRVLTTTHDHYSSDVAWQLRSERDGVNVDRIDLYDDAASVSVPAIVTRIEAAIRPETRLVAVTWVHSSTGVKLPIRAISNALVKINRKRDPASRVFLAVDGVHGFGVEDFDVESLACDIFIAGCHKWLFGPRGTGIVWASDEAWAEIAPCIAPFEAAPFVRWLEGDEAAGPGGLMSTPGGFHSFEHRWSLAPAFAFQENIGRPAIEARIHELNRRLKAGLGKIDRVRVHTPLDSALSSGIVAFEVEGMSPDQVVAGFGKHKILASASPYRVPYPRLAPGLLNDEAQVDRALETLKQMIA